MIADRRASWWLGRVAALALVLLLPGASAAAPSSDTRNVLVLLSGDASNPFGQAFVHALHQSLQADQDEATPLRVTMYAEYLDLNRFGDDPGYLDSVRRWVRDKYAGRDVDLVVSLYDRASVLASELRPELAPDAPILFAGVSRGVAESLRQKGNVTGWQLAVDMHRILGFMRALLPEMRRIVLVSGAGADRRWLAIARDGLPRIASDITVEALEALPIAELDQRLRQLPDDAAVFVVSYLVQPDGRPVDPALFARDIVSNSRRPVFGLTDITADDGYVGGVLYSLSEAGQRTGQMARQVLASSAEAVPPVTEFPMRQIADARALERWAIDRARVPPGTLVLNETPSILQEHYGKIIGVGCMLVALSALVVGLVAERRRRQRAEADAVQRLGELSFMNRRAALGELSASIAHDINQPLGAILNNAEAVEILLGLDPPPMDEIREAVRAIRDDDVRAGEIVRRMRSLLSRREIQQEPVDVRKLVQDTLAILRSDALASHIQLASEVFGNPVVAGEGTHLRQLLLNLCVNGMDAMRPDASAGRALSVSAADDDRHVVIKVTDRGPGFSPEAAERAFEPFFTTKGETSGMGMGLAIAKRIVEAHQGSITVANNVPGPGATVTVLLPRHGAH